MYGEPFGIPTPDKQVHLVVQGGDVFRSGCCYERATDAFSISRPATKPTDLLPPANPQGDGNACKWAGAARNHFRCVPQAKTPHEPFRRRPLTSAS